MKTFIAVLLFTLTCTAQKVIVLDSVCKIIKFDVKAKNIEKTLDSLKGRKFYIIRNIRGKEYECLFIREKELNII
jgi:hypothetical protein